MKRALLLGAISPFCDLVWEMVELNITPIICDYYVDAPAKKLGYPSFDISTMDVEALNKLADEYDVDGVVSAFSDRNLIPALNICESRGLSYYFNREIIECLTDKKEMKRFFQEHNIPVVKYGVHEITNIESELKEYSLPIIMKPIDAYGSKGIVVCESVDEVVRSTNRVLNQSVKYKDKIIVEEFYIADEISISAMVRNGETFITCIYDVNRNFGEEVTLASVSFPSKYTEKYYHEFGILVSKIVSLRNIADGPVTLQCFIGENGIKVSELLCRLAGGSPYLYPTYFGGPNLARMLIQNAVGEEIDYQNLSSFIPICSSNKIFYDVQVLVNTKGVIHHNIDTSEVKKQFNKIVDLRVYYPDECELVNVGSGGIVFAKVICEIDKTDDYYELISHIESVIVAYDEHGEKVSFVRRPNRMGSKDTYDIDWDFLQMIG